MPYTTRHEEMKVATLRAFRAAVHDARLERSGTRLAHFFDTDVVTGAMLSENRYINDIIRKQPSTRAIVRALFVDGYFPKVRLASSHLDEFVSLLRTIKQKGGIAAYIQEQTLGRDDYAHERNVFHSTLGKFRNNIKKAIEGGDREVVRVLHEFDMRTFAALEAEMTSRIWAAGGVYEDLLNLDGDLGETKDELDLNDMVDDLASLIAAVRKNPRRKHSVASVRASTGGRYISDSTRDDAVALLAITRLWIRYTNATLQAKNDRDNNHIPCEVRFYTQTDALRQMCESTDEGKSLLINPDDPPVSDGFRVDSVHSALRSSTYYILRSSVPGIFFTDRTTSNDIDEHICQFARVDYSIQKEWSMYDEEHDIIDEDLYKNIEQLRENTFRLLALNRTQSRVFNALRASDDRYVNILHSVSDSERESLERSISKLSLDCNNSLLAVCAKAEHNLNGKWATGITKSMIENSLRRWIDRDMDLYVQQFFDLISSNSSSNFDVSYPADACDNQGYTTYVSSLHGTCSTLLLARLSKTANRAIQYSIETCNNPDYSHKLRRDTWALQCWGLIGDERLIQDRLIQLHQRLVESEVSIESEIERLRALWGIAYLTESAVQYVLMNTTTEEEFIKQGSAFFDWDSVIAIGDSIVPNLDHGCANIAQLLISANAALLSDNSQLFDRLAALLRQAVDDATTLDIYSRDACKWAGEILFSRPDRQKAIASLDFSEFSKPPLLEIYHRNHSVFSKPRSE